MNYSFPEDMENRRLADLQRWALSHPNDPMVPMLMQQVTGTEPAEQESDMRQGYGWFREKQPGSKEKGKLKLSTGTPGPMNKWDTVSTLELLNEMKMFQDSLNKLAERGIRVTACTRWPSIARNLPNRCGLEPAKFAKSCQVHFANLCRVYKGQKRTTKDVGLEPSVQDAMDEYFQHAAAGSPPYPPILKRLEMKNNRLQRGENEAADVNAMIVRNPYMQTAGHTRLDAGEKNWRIAAARRAAVQKQSSRAPEKIGYSNKGGSPTKEWKTSARPSSSDDESHHRMDEESSSWEDSPENRDVIEPEGAAAGRYQRHQEVKYASTKSVRSGMNRWDPLSSLELLAAMMKFEECRKITGAKNVNKWERVASQLPNRWKVEPLRYSRSCKAHYHELLRAYKKEISTAKMFPEKPLAEEVRGRLEEWLQFSGSRLRFNKRLTETPCVLEKKNIASERGVKAALFSPVLTEKTKDERMTIKKNAGQYEYAKTNGGDSVNHGNDGLIKNNDDLSKCTWKGFDHETSEGSDNESSWDDDCMLLEPNKERNMDKDESKRRMQKRYRDLKGKQKKSVTQKIPASTKNVLNGDEMTTNATYGKFQQLDAQDVKGKGVYKAYTASQYTTSLFVRSRDLDSREKAPKGKEKKSMENAWETGISDKLLRRKMMTNGKLKHNCQADVMQKELYKPFTGSDFDKSRDLESRGKGPTLHSNVDSDDTSDSDNDSSSRDDASEVEGDEYFKGLKKQSGDQNFEKRKKSLKKTILEKTSTVRKIVVSDRQMSSGKLQQSEVDIGGILSPRKLNFIAGRLEEPRSRDVDDRDKSSHQNRLDAVSENESSWDDSMHLDDDNQTKSRRDARRFKMRWRGMKQKVGNTSQPGKKIVNLLSSGKVQKVDEICNPLKVDGLCNPLWDRSMERDKDRDLNRETTSPLPSNFKLGSDQIKADENESSWDDSMHLGGEDDEMDGDETSRMKKKRMRDRQAKLKKSSAWRIGARTFSGRGDVRKFPSPWIQIDN